MPAAIRVSPAVARRFHRRALLLDRPVATVGDALAHLGYVQMDPINVCGRMHDLILRNRVAGYVEGGLGRHLHGDSNALPAKHRTAFEHHVPSTGILVAFPFEAWPHLLAAMQRRTRRHGAWSGRLTPRERGLSVRILAEIAARGPLSSDDIDDRRRSRQMVWGAFSLAKSTLQKLFFHGRLLIARRDENNRRLYDLPGRVLPPAVLHQPEPAKTDTARWEALLKLRQRRLTTLKQSELPLVADRVQPVQVEGCPPLYCLREDARLFDLPPGDVLVPAAQLLAPLDPLIYDRRLTSTLWRFDYTWEAYTPPAKRKRGHYALPVLAGSELVGHVDARADRTTGRLCLLSRLIRRGHKIAPVLRELAGFLGLKPSPRPRRRPVPAA
jgi:hypothetical protein